MMCDRLTPTRQLDESHLPMMPLHADLHRLFNQLMLLENLFGIAFFQSKVYPLSICPNLSVQSCACVCVCVCVIHWISKLVH